MTPVHWKRLLPHSKLCVHTAHAPRSSARHVSGARRRLAVTSSHGVTLASGSCPVQTPGKHRGVLLPATTRQPQPQPQPTWPSVLPQEGALGLTQTTA